VLPLISTREAAVDRDPPALSGDGDFPIRLETMWIGGGQGLAGVFEAA
jgi:hypothetical protein